MRFRMKEKVLSNDFIQTWIGGQKYDWRCCEKRAVNERFCGVKGLAGIR